MTENEIYETLNGKLEDYTLKESNDKDIKRIDDTLVELKGDIKDTKDTIIKFVFGFAGFAGLILLGIILKKCGIDIPGF